VEPSSMRAFAMMTRERIDAKIAIHRLSRTAILTCLMGRWHALAASSESPQPAQPPLRHPLLEYASAALPEFGHSATRATSWPAITTKHVTTTSTYAEWEPFVARMAIQTGRPAMVRPTLPWQIAPQERRQIPCVPATCAALDIRRATPGKPRTLARLPAKDIKHATSMTSHWTVT